MPAAQGSTPITTVNAEHAEHAESDKSRLSRRHEEPADSTAGLLCRPAYCARLRGLRGFVVVRRRYEPERVFLSLCESAVDDRHVPFVVTLAGGRREVVQPLDLRGAQFDAVGGRVFLDAGDPLGAGNRSDVVAFPL